MWFRDFQLQSGHMHMWCLVATVHEWDIWDITSAFWDIPDHSLLNNLVLAPFAILDRIAGEFLSLTSMSLEGLHKVLAKDDTLRSKLLKDDTLIAWPSAKLVGVHSNKDAQRLNSYLLKVVADYWCGQWDSPSMIPVDAAKWEAV